MLREILKFTYTEVNVKFFLLKNFKECNRMRENQRKNYQKEFKIGVTVKKNSLGIFFAHPNLKPTVFFTIMAVINFFSQSNSLEILKTC